MKYLVNYTLHKEPRPVNAYDVRNQIRSEFSLEKKLHKSTLPMEKRRLHL